MPAYRFAICDHTNNPDPDPVVLPDLAAAKVVAVQLAGQLIKDHATRFWGAEDWSMEVADHTGLVLFQLTFTVTLAPAIS